MSPQRYIAQEGLNWEVWAKRLGCSLSYLHEVCSRKKAGTAEFLFRIEDDTLSAVTAREMEAARKRVLAGEPAWPEDVEASAGKAA